MLRKINAIGRRLVGEERAAAMVEFAIVAPLLFVLIFGIIDFGRVFFLYNNLTNAAREGARLGAVLPLAGSVAQIQTATKARINDAGANAATVNVTYPVENGVTNVRVQIANYPFTPVTFLVLSTSINLNVTAAFRNEFQ